MSADARRRLEREIEKLLVYLRAAFVELSRFGPIAELDRRALRRHQAWPIAEKALNSIWLAHRMLEERLASLGAAYRTPLATLSQESRTFYTDVYLPGIEAAIDLFLQTAIILDIDGEDSEEQRPAESAAPAERVWSDPEEFLARHADSIGVEPYSDLELTQFIRNVYELAEWRVEEGHIDVDIEFYRSGVQALRSPWFKPEQWLQNAARIRPVFVDPSAAVPSWVAGRMAEVHACLIHDLSLAAIAMCRATLEAALMDRAALFGVEPFEQEGRRKEARKLSAIAKELSRQVPELGTSLDVVIKYGNQALLYSSA